MAKEIILRENALTESILFVAEFGKIFKGRYVALIKEYEYVNAWQDREIIKRFRSKDRLCSYLDKKYPEADIDLSGTCLE